MTAPKKSTRSVSSSSPMTDYERGWRAGRVAAVRALETAKKTPRTKLPRTKPPGKKVVGKPQWCKICLVTGPAGLTLYINEVRVAGQKPWGGGRMLEDWRLDLEDVYAALQTSVSRKAHHAAS
jgi:hypothetical protein